MKLKNEKTAIIRKKNKVRHYLMKYTLNILTLLDLNYYSLVPIRRGLLQFGKKLLFYLVLALLLFISVVILFRPSINIEEQYNITFSIYTNTESALEQVNNIILYYDDNIKNCQENLIYQKYIDLKSLLTSQEDDTASKLVLVTLVFEEYPIPKVKSPLNFKVLKCGLIVFLSIATLVCLFLLSSYLLIVWYKRQITKPIQGYNVINTYILSDILEVIEY